MASRADFITETGVRPTRYSDFLTNFDRNPITGALAVVRDDQAVKLALRNLVLTITGERPYRSSIGSHIYDRIGDMAGDGVARNALRDSLQQMVKHAEPRVEILGIDVTADRSNENGLAVVIAFGMRNTGTTDSLNVPITKRARILFFPFLIPWLAMHVSSWWNILALSS